MHCLCDRTEAGSPSPPPAQDQRRRFQYATSSNSTQEFEPIEMREYNNLLTPTRPQRPLRALTYQPSREQNDGLRLN